MRILCLNLKKTSNVALADIFLKFSPRVQFRKPNWLFIDITSTTALFQNEELLLEECFNVCRILGLSMTAAIADTPWGAQTLTQFHERIITTPGEDEHALDPLPVTALIWLEGLKPWNAPSSNILQIASFFQLVGLSTLAQIQQINQEAFRERWGELGVQIWQRLHGLEKQFISPLIPIEPLHCYQYLDFPISLLPFLLRSLEKSLLFLFARLQGRSLFAQRLTLTLLCEYSGGTQAVVIEPASPNRDLVLFMTLLEQKLALLDLENPIREFEIDIVGCEEKQRQLDFWDTASTDHDKLQRLVSLLQQSDCEAGFFQLRDGVFPEKTWVYGTESEPFTPLQDEVTNEQNAYQVRPAYGQSVLHAPRPTRLLQKPQSLGSHEVKSLQLLSHGPIERLEDEWWKGEAQERDYYFAVSPQGQCLWIYQDRKSNSYFLHGYFD